MTPEIDIGLGSLAGAAAGLGGLIAALLHVRKQLAKDNTSIVSEKSEQNQIARLTQEIERLTLDEDKLKLEASQLRSQRIADVHRIAACESDREHLKRERDRLMRDIKRAVRGLPPEIRDVLETDFSALADVDERIEPGPR